MLNKQSITTLAILAATASTVSAFKDTHPLVAFSSIELPSLSLLSSLPALPSVFHPVSPVIFDQSQAAFPSTDSPVTSDLCALESILLISIPGFHFSDLSLLPTSSSNGIKSVIAAATKGVSQALTIPYISSRSTGSARAVRKLVESFKGDCKALVETPEGEKNFWAGDEQSKVVRIEELKGLEEWELVGANAREMRKAIVGSIDSLVQSHLQTLRQPYLVILTTLPAATLSTLTAPPTKHHTKLAKRQFFDNDGEEAFEGESASGEDSVKYTVLDHNDVEYSASALAPNATSIFAIPPNSGLFHKYVFFTPPIIFALLVSLLLLIPVVVFTTSALTSIETVAGLEQKMTGTVGLDPSKA